jgi:hypothetical protein
MIITLGTLGSPDRMEEGARGDIDGRWSRYCTRTRSDDSVESVGFERLAVVVAVGADCGGLRTVPVDRGVTDSGITAVERIVATRTTTD